MLAPSYKEELGDEGAIVVTEYGQRLKYQPVARLHTNDRSSCFGCAGKGNKADVTGNNIGLVL